MEARNNKNRGNYSRPNYSPRLRQMIKKTTTTGVGSPLFDKLCERETLLEAWRQTRKGRSPSARRFSGAADRVSLDLFERNLERNLNRLRYDLRDGSYRPDPISHFHLPKRGGGKRTLAVLTIKDRVIQRAALDLLEPVFEPEFLPCSYAYRPKRSVEDALLQVETYYSQGFRWAVDADIQSFFDSLDRRRLVLLLSDKIDDRRLLALLKLWLEGTPPVPQVRVETPPPVEQSPESEDRIGRFARTALEGGLDWGINQLSGQTQRYYLPRYESYGRWEEKEEETSEPQTFEGDLRKEALRQLGSGGTLLGLTMAKHLIKKGILPGKVGLVVKAGAAAGTAGALGVAAFRQWQRQQRRPEAVVITTAYFVPPRQRGIAQGSILSPLFSNIYLHDFDMRLTGQGFRLVRFADDLLILCASEREANAALTQAENALSAIALNFNPAKTRVCKLDKGFTFLGATMGANGQWRDEDGRISPESGQNWLARAGSGWLKNTARLKPGIVQRGSRNINKDGQD